MGRGARGRPGPLTHRPRLRKGRVPVSRGAGGCGESRLGDRSAPEVSGETESEAEPEKSGRGLRDRGDTWRRRCGAASGGREPSLQRRRGTQQQRSQRAQSEGRAALAGPAAGAWERRPGAEAGMAPALLGPRDGRRGAGLSHARPKAQSLSAGEGGHPAPSQNRLTSASTVWGSTVPLNLAPRDPRSA